MANATHGLPTIRLRSTLALLVLATIPTHALAQAFAFSGHNPIPNMHCISVNEPSDPDSWKDNYFCSRDDEGMRWSTHDPIPGMTCVQIFENSEPQSHTWNDNYLCFPPTTRWEFAWRSAGRVAGDGFTECAQWLEASDKHTWNDNFLCYRPRQRS